MRPDKVYTIGVEGVQGALFFAHKKPLFCARPDSLDKGLANAGQWLFVCKMSRKGKKMSKRRRSIWPKSEKARGMISSPKPANAILEQTCQFDSSEFFLR